MLHVRNGAYRRPLVCQAGVGVGAIPLPTFRLQNRRVRAGLVAAFRGLVRLRRGRLFQRRATFVHGSFTDTVCVLRYLASRGFVVQRTMVNADPPRYVLYKGANAGAVSNRAGRRKVCVVSQLVTVLLVRDPHGDHLGGCKGDFVALVS